MERSFLTGKNIWITGAGSGIGRSLALLASAQGCTVLLSGRNAAKLENVAKECEGGEKKHFPIACDVASAESIDVVASRFGGDLPMPDILINNAGIGLFAPLAEMSLADIDAMLNINLRGALLCTRAVLPAMMEKQGGTIVNVLSVAANAGFAGATVYGASKAGLIAASASLRAETRNYNLKVIDVIPGATATDIWTEEMLSQHSSRMMKPETVARAIMALLSLSPDAMPESLTLRPQQGDL